MTEAFPAPPLPFGCLRLDDDQVAILEFEKSFRIGPGAHGGVGRAAAKEQEVRARFGLSLPRYHQVLNALIDEPAALAHDPLLVKRLRRVREQRQAARSASRLP